MNQQIIEQFLGMGDGAIFSVGDMFLGMSVTTILNLIIAKSYKDTHSGPNYSKTFLTSLFIMSISTSIVMMIIGSNIARAFSLIGALSIIRFRTAVKDPRDTAYLFAGVVTGMGCGTGFYLPAIVLTLFLCTFLYVYDRFEFSLKKNLTSIIKLNMQTGVDPSEHLKPFKNLSIINKITDYSNSSITYVYSFSPANNDSFDSIEDQLGAISGVNQVSIYQADQHAPF
ncbi:MAG: DUF4956 domain-containing protein [Bacteriovoracaceae bacterium]|nr:DUF4956 domain-containing protein [Bacteriovoracaceae bacterium]